MKNIYSLRTALFAGLLFVCITAGAQTNELPRAVPEDEGIPSQAVANLFDSLMSLPKTDIHSVMVLRHGKVIGEIYPAPFAPHYRHTMYSCSKTFLAATVGLAIADNRLRTDDRVGAILPEVLPDCVSPQLAAMTVHDLLTMTSGITPDWEMRNNTDEWLRTYLAKPVAEPGTKFQYDSMCSYLLAAIVQKVMGKTVLDCLKQRIFKPMNITEVGWEVSPEGYNTGGWGLHIQSESLAKFGLLLLNKGNWQGEQLLPAEWVEQMMTEQQPDTGYGYHVWACEYPGAWRADGAFGQYILIIPDKDMVIVITECTLTNGATQRRLVWQRLIPQAADNPLPTNAKSYKRLLKLQQDASLPTAQGKDYIPGAARLGGKSIILQDNKYGWKTLTFDVNRNENIINMTITDCDGYTYVQPFGYRRWLTTHTKACPPYSIGAVGSFEGIERPFHVAGSYGWAKDGTLHLKVHYVDWISALDICIRPEENKAFLTISENFSDITMETEGTLQ